jgi:hypothetical protein
LDPDTFTSSPGWKTSTVTTSRDGAVELSLELDELAVRRCQALKWPSPGA